MIADAIKRLALSQDLDISMAKECMNEIMSGDATKIQMASFLTSLKMKGETVDEIFAFAKIMRERSLQVESKHYETLVDTCGTGGDGIHTFNISTAAMFIAAGAGVRIAKHGNRSITSKCGAADVLESLGANIENSADAVAKCIEESGIGFMFAPLFHTSMKHIMPVRKELGFRTVFNILGPLSNPANAKRQLMGVFDKNLVLKLAEVLKKLGLKKAMVVHGKDGMDEITLTGDTYVAELDEGNIVEYEINPTKFGFKLCNIEDLRGGDARDNAKILRDILDGKSDAKSDIAILNSAAAIYVAGISKSIEEGILIAKDSIKSKKALVIMGKYINCSKSFS